jgi:hypothetical protein
MVVGGFVLFAGNALLHLGIALNADFNRSEPAGTGQSAS